VDSLLSGSPEAERLAADSLERLDDPRLPATLLERLRTPAYRYEAGRALSRLGLGSGVDTLVSGLSDTSGFVRWSVATALGVQGVARAGPSLVRALDDPAMPVRRAAAISLGQLADTTWLGALLDHARDPREEVRAAIAEALGQFGDRATTVLGEMAEQDSGLVVIAAVKSLGHTGNEVAVPRIGIVLLDGPVPARLAASESLGGIGGPAAESLLVAAAVDDPVPLVRESAIRALAHSRPDLVLGLSTARRKTEEDAFVRVAWVEAIDRLSGEQALGALRLLAMEDVSPDVRAAALEALRLRGESGPRRP